MKTLNERSETMKLLEENRGGKLFVTGLGDDFLNLTLKAKATETKTKWGYIKLKSTKKQKTLLIK